MFPYRVYVLRIYKSIVRPHLDYGDVIYDQPNNSTLLDKIESIQYNAALAIIGAIKGISSGTSLEYLKDRRWLRRLYYFHKILSAKLTL